MVGAPNKMRQILCRQFFSARFFAIPFFLHYFSDLIRIDSYCSRCKSPSSFLMQNTIPFHMWFRCRRFVDMPRPIKVCCSMTIQVLCPRWKRPAQDLDEATNNDHHCQLYEHHRKHWNVLLVRIGTHYWYCLWGRPWIAWLAKTVFFQHIRRSGISSIPIRDKTSIVAKWNHINRYGSCIIRTLFSSTINDGLFGGAKCKNLHPRCQQRHVLWIGGCEVFHHEFIYFSLF